MYKTLLEEKKTIDDLDDFLLEVHLDKVTVDRGKIDSGAFGSYIKPNNAAGKMGFFLPETREIKKELKATGMTDAANEWSYVACGGYWLSLSLAAKIGRNQIIRDLGVLDEADSSLAILVWSMVYAKIEARVSDLRGTFIRLAISGRKNSGASNFTKN